MSNLSFIYLNKLQDIFTELLAIINNNPLKDHIFKQHYIQNVNLQSTGTQMGNILTTVD